MQNQSTQIRGPFSYENWKASISGGPLLHTVEYPLFTDAHIIGGPFVKYGPYKLFNAIRMGNARSARPSMVLREDNYIDYKPPQMDKTDASRYHGGLLSDEIAALVSLCLGIRLKAGSKSRVFEPDGDASGLPISLEYSADPILLIMESPLILPRARGEHNLENTAILSTFCSTPSSAAVALVRAARLYQEALWIVESTPELSWIMLTSAIETVAGYWRKESEPSIERLRASESLAGLERELASHGDEDFVKRVADYIAPYMGSTKKFVDFVLEFLPPPPEHRPPESFQISWELRAMKKNLSKIYDYRSKALHGGVPFPAPMSNPPHRFRQDSPQAEIPTGLATSMKGGVWIAKDLPMLIHTFEYIVRCTLLNWWKSVAV